MNEEILNIKKMKKFAKKVYANRYEDLVFEKEYIKNGINEKDFTEIRRTFDNHIDCSCMKDIFRLECSCSDYMKKLSNTLDKRKLRCNETSDKFSCDECTAYTCLLLVIEDKRINK